MEVGLFVFIKSLNACYEDAFRLLTINLSSSEIVRTRKKCSVGLIKFVLFHSQRLRIINLKKGTEAKIITKG